MKTIFAKYNSERLPKYQIVTKIVVDDNGQKYAIKEALCDEAKAHIEDIYNNYELLKNTHNLNLVKPTKIENGVMFEMAKGISFENILSDIIRRDQNDMNRAVAPLKQADDAILVDSTDMGIDQVISHIENLINNIDKQRG